MTAALVGGGRPARGVEAPAPWSVVLLAAAVLATGFARPLAGGFTVADVLIAGVIVLAALEVLARRQPLRPIALAVLLPILLVLAGSLIGALNVGLARWVVYDLVRDLGAAAALLALLQVLDGAPPRWFRPPTRALVAVVAVVAVHLVFLGGTALRSQATFPNPNVAGHFVATCFMALLVLPTPRRSRIAGLVAAGAGLVATGSFGAMIQLGSGLGVLGVGALRRVRPATRQLATFGFVSAVVVLALAVGSGRQLLPEGGGTTGYNAAHFERSSTGRLELWSAALDQVVETPWGIGPGSSRNLEVLRQGERTTETHSEPLAFLSERGALGLLGLLALWATLWRFAVPGGVARAMIVGLVVASIVRETSHYRHLWILLALVLTYERAVSAAHPRRDPAAAP